MSSVHTAADSFPRESCLRIQNYLLYCEVDKYCANHFRAILLTLLKNSPVSGCKVSDVFHKTFWKPASDISYQEKLKKIYVLDREGLKIFFCF